MADGITVSLNIPDFKRQLAAFGEDFERKTVRSATLAAAQIFKKAVINLAPTLRSASKRRVAGTLKRSIYVKRSKDSTRGREHYVVSFKKKRKEADPFYGRFLEAGWIPRGPGNKRKGGKRFRALTRAREAGKKITKYSFIGPAFRQVGREALRAFNARIQQRLDRENAKGISAVGGTLTGSSE